MCAPLITQTTSQIWDTSNHCPTTDSVDRHRQSSTTSSIPARMSTTRVEAGHLDVHRCRPQMAVQVGSVSDSQAKPVRWQVGAAPAEQRATHCYPVARLSPQPPPGCRPITADCQPCYHRYRCWCKRLSLLLCEYCLRQLLNLITVGVASVIPSPR